MAEKPVYLTPANVALLMEVVRKTQFPGEMAEQVVEVKKALTDAVTITVEELARIHPGR